MTTIAAVAAKGRVWMAADGCTNVYDRPIIDGAKKIRRLTTADRTELLLATCGDGALADWSAAHASRGRPSTADPPGGDPSPGRSSGPGRTSRAA